MRVKARQAGLDAEVDSAGLIDYHRGELPDGRMRSHAAQRGYRLAHRSRPVTPADFERFDLVVAMDGQNVRGLLRLADKESERRKICMAAQFISHCDTDIVPDPYYGGPEAFELALDLIEDCCDGLIRKLKDEAAEADARKNNTKS